MKFLPLIIAAIVLFDAWTDARKPALIKHLRGALLYSVSCASLCLIWRHLWYHIIALAALTRAAWLDPAFNGWLGLPFKYNGDKGNKKRKRSIIDRFEDWITGKTNISILWVKIAYIVVWAGYVVFYYINIKR